MTEKFQSNLIKIERKHWQKLKKIKIMKDKIILVKDGFFNKENWKIWKILR